MGSVKEEKGRKSLLESLFEAEGYEPVSVGEVLKGKMRIAKRPPVFKVQDSDVKGNHAHVVRPQHLS